MQTNAVSIQHVSRAKISKENLVRQEDGMHFIKKHIIGKPSMLTVHYVSRGGFTLAELILAMAIIAILATIAIPSYSAYLKEARIKQIIAEIRLIEFAINVYQTNNNRFPDKLSDVNIGDTIDPWGHPYQYLNIADGGIEGKGKFRKDRAINPLNADFDLYSMGEDGQSKLPVTAKESRDDIIRANSGAYVGTVEEFDPE